MMKFEEQMARIKSVSTMSLTVLHERMEKWRMADKLSAYNTLFEPPVTIREANETTRARLWKEMDELKELEDKLEKVHDKLNALPSWSIVEHFDGTRSIIVYKGMLPDFEETSKNEAEALKMLADYYARETA